MVRRRIIWVVALAMAVVMTARADMIPVSGPVATASLPDSEPLGSESSPVAYEDFLFPFSAVDPLAFGLPRGVLADSPEPGPPQPVIILSDEQDSLSLCLYALFSLGLCKSAPWVKRLSFGIIPSWYHEGGPYQIGHSLAIEPDCLVPQAVCCSTQPDWGMEKPSQPYRRQAIALLWRKSQFIPSVDAPRGPPFCS
ncbi:MAG TPA: hypothetical protein VLI39_03055 [Sedimentisphaerales bacterium]|nr:hypothetical protein [Sedimentisphaerales bacterium]